MKSLPPPTRSLRGGARSDRWRPTATACLLLGSWLAIAAPPRIVPTAHGAAITIDVATSDGDPREALGASTEASADAVGGAFLRFVAEDLSLRLPPASTVTWERYRRATARAAPELPCTADSSVAGDGPHDEHWFAAWCGPTRTEVALGDADGVRLSVWGYDGTGFRRLAASEGRLAADLDAVVRCPVLMVAIRTTSAGPAWLHYRLYRDGCGLRTDPEGGEASSSAVGPGD